MLDGINVMSLALMAAVTWQMARATLADPISIAVTSSSAALLIATRLNSMWLIAAGAAIGLARAW